MKIGLFGGSFDPIHRAHTTVAESALQRFKLDKIIFVPADVQPLKQDRMLAPLYHRYAMLSLATRNEPRFVPRMMESGISYTSATVKQLLSEIPEQNEISVILGYDAFNSLNKWHNFDYLCKKCEFIVANRPSFELQRPLPEWQISYRIMDDVCMEISATDIRTVLSKGKKLSRNIIDPLVMQYIEKTALYR
jgi:nicotinate-nucleotide adenylyltransferase